jgi:glycosyltransferase involved in cell wall biosynthesis
LLSAWGQLGSDKDGLTLVLAGAGGSVYREAKLEPPADVVLAGYVADEDLPAVYGGAEAFVYPSLYEGFGLPVIEAMACGTPVVCSNTTSLKEVAADAAVGVDPLDEAAIADGLRQLLSDASLRTELRARGLARAKDFHWNRAAEETWNVLSRAVV